MNFQSFLTDPLLCLLGFLILTLWAGIKYGLNPGVEKVKDLNSETVTVTFLRILSGFILVFASSDKLGNATSFAQMITNYQILSPHLVPLAAVILPWLEFLSGLCLVFGFSYRGSALLCCGLMTLYALAISFDLLRGVDINCGCGLTDPTEKATWWSVLRDLEFMAMALIVLVSPLSYVSFDDSKKA